MIQISTSDTFHVGDEIVFKDLDEMLFEFGADSHGMPKVAHGFNEKMQYLCGQVAHIKSINGNSVRTVENIEGDTGLTFRQWWSISFDMIRPYDGPYTDQVEVSDWERFMNE